MHSEDAIRLPHSVDRAFSRLWTLSLANSHALILLVDLSQSYLQGMRGSICQGSPAPENGHTDAHQVFSGRTPSRAGRLHLDAWLGSPRQYGVSGPTTCSSSQPCGRGGLRGCARLSSCWANEGAPPSVAQARALQSRLNAQGREDVAVEKSSLDVPLTSPLMGMTL
ncbi:hypothetical protein BV20DRAFT_704522 [Pilatotrama ljubarskyi]|nr:hypothetical protein BV20DRAFT_704522 [Pilatotrama ljubarskyi]